MSSTASSSQHGSNSNVLLNSIRINAPVVQEWPWENGLPLEHGSMASSLQNSLRLNSTQQEQDFVDMVLKFAKALDEYDQRDSYQQEDRKFVWVYLGGHKAKTEARSTIMDLEQWNMSQISQIDSVAHGLMRYRLIDILANVLDCKKNPKRKSFAAVQTPILPPRVQGIRTSLASWPAVVHTFRDIILRGGGQSSSLPTNHFLPASSTSSPEQVVLLTGLSNLVNAAKNIQDIKYYKVMVNVQLVVFALCWFGMGEVEFPKDEQSFLEAIITRSKNMGVNLTQEAIRQLQEVVGTNILRAVARCFMLATSVSPLLMLIPKKYHAEGVAFRRDALLAYSMSLGNEKPDSLSRVETALWNSFLRVASGTSITTALSAFSVTAGAIVDGPPRSSADAGWFNGAPPEVSLVSRGQIRSVSPAVSRSAGLGIPTPVLHSASTSERAEQSRKKLRENEEMLASMRATAMADSASREQAEARWSRNLPPAIPGFAALSISPEASGILPLVSSPSAPLSAPTASSLVPATTPSTSGTPAVSGPSSGSAPPGSSVTSSSTSTVAAGVVPPNSITSPPVEPNSGQRPGETWKSFFARREAADKFSEGKESYSHFDSRMARIAHASKFLVPGKSGARVFYWEDVNGFRVRRAAGRRNYDSIWEGYGDKQRRYDSFRNEWDLCEDFDPTDGPEEDSESDDTADPPRVSADHISVEQGGGTMEVVQDPAVVPVGHISLQQLVNQAGDETDMDITPSAELGDPMDVVQPDLTDNYIAQRKTPADDGIDEDEEGQLGKEVGDGEQEEEQGSTESGNLIRQKQKEGDGIEEQRRKKIEEKRKRALEDLELTRKRKLATRQRSKMQARKEKAEGQEEEEDKEEGEEDKEQEDEEQDEDEEQEAEENVLAPVKPTWKKRVMAKGGLKGKRKGKSSSMHAAQTGHLLLEGHDFLNLSLELLQLAPPKIIPALEISILGANPDLPPLQYKWLCPEVTLEDERNLLCEVQASVESIYQNGRPLSQLKSARMQTYDPSERYVSSIFVVNCDTFKKMTTAEIHAIFRHRHILVEGVETSEMEFDLEGLGSLGSITLPRSMQVANLQTAEDPDQGLKSGSLADMYALSKDPQNSLIVNALDIPMGDCSVEVPPRYREMATNELAWQRTRQRKGLQALKPLSDELKWGTAALKHATSWQHVDDEGFGTVVTNMTGCKYWVVARRRRDSPVSEWHRNMGRAVAFGETIHPLQASSYLYEHEGLLLTPGTVFFMRPTTPHYVLTVENSITYGRHFYTASTISDSVWGAVHSFVLGYAVTNALHDNTRTLFRRVMAMWYDHFMSTSVKCPIVSLHVPDVMTFQGLCDMMALGNLCSLGWILERTSYTAEITKEELEECQVAKWHYLQLRLWFNKGYIVRFGGRPISPMSIFRRSLVEFMAAVVTEKSNMEDEAPSMPGCSSDEVVKRMEEFLKEEDEDLLVVFHDLVKKGHDSLDWSSGTFKITTRRPEDAFEESLTFLDFILLSEGHQEDAMVTVSQDDAQGGDADNDPLMAEGPISPLAAVSGQNKRKSAPEVEASDGDGASSSQTTTQSIQAVLPRKKRRRVPAAEVENDRTEGGRALPSDVKGKARAL